MTMDDTGTETRDDVEDHVAADAAGGDTGDAPSRPDRHGLAGGAWAGIAVGVVLLALGAGLIGYFVGRGSDPGAATGDTSRTDQKVCAALVAAQQEIEAADAVSGAFVVAVLRRHVAGVLSDAPDSAVTAAVRDTYAAAGDLADGDADARAAYDEKLAIAKYQCNKVATWDWPAGP